MYEMKVNTTECLCVSICFGVHVPTTSCLMASILIARIKKRNITSILHGLKHLAAGVEPALSLNNTSTK